MTQDTSTDTPDHKCESAHIKKSASTLHADIQEFWLRKTIWTLPSAMDVQADGLPKMSIAAKQADVSSDSNCSFLEVEARWFDEQGAIAYATAVLVGPRVLEHAVSSADVLSALDVLDPDQDFAYALVETHADREPFSPAGHGAYWVSEFRALELHPRCRGQGLGARLGAQFLGELRSRHCIGFFVLNAFPLQYGGDYFGSPREHLCRNEHPAQFEQDRGKLRRMYADAWGARPLPGSEDYMVVLGSTTLQVRATVAASKWLLEP